jgi:hypothetical protein
VRNLKATCAALAIAASIAIFPLAALALGETPNQAISFSDGSQASSYHHCGDMDLCATIAYANGQKLSIFSEGAASCQPYVLHFVLVSGDRTIYEFSRPLDHDPIRTESFNLDCGNSRETQLTLDHGYIHMNVNENKDGTLSIVFSPTSKK